MYINRQAEEKFKIANAAVSIQFGLFDNLITIKELAKEASVSEKQVYCWANLLREAGLKLFSSLKPGRKKKDLASEEEEKENEELLVSDSINILLRAIKNQEGKNQKFSPEQKQKILRERDRLKKEHSVTYEIFAERIGIHSGVLRLWDSTLKKEGPEGLEEKSRAPKNSPSKLAPWLIKEVVSYGVWWKRRHRKIKLTEFGGSFRRRHQRLLAACGKSNLSNKTIARYLKEYGVYKEKEERPKGKRGNFEYYFPGAQVFIDTVIIRFLWIKAKVIVTLDAVSRTVLHQEGFLKETASKVIKSLEASFKRAERLGIKVLSVVSDHGKPYKANKVWEYLKGQGVLRIFAHPYWPQDKARIERYNRTLREALSDTWKVFIAFIKGILIWINQICLNLILIGINSEYEKKKGIDGKSPRDRLKKEVDPEYERETKKVLSQREKESQVKGELITILCKEFDFGAPIVNVKNHLFGYPKEIIEESARVLRRKQVSTKFLPEKRWAYFGAVLDNKEKERKEAELHRAKEVIRQEEIKLKDMEEKRKILEERGWRDTHPEEVLDEAIEWKLAMWDNPFTKVYYDKEIIENSKKILMKHSSFTAGLKVNKMCERIEDKNKLENKEVIKQGHSLPSGNELNIAREKVINLIQRAYLECRDQIPAFHGIRSYL